MAEQRLYDALSGSIATAVQTAVGPIDLDTEDAPAVGEALVMQSTGKLGWGSAGSGGSDGGGGNADAIVVGTTGVVGGTAKGLVYKDANGVVQVSTMPIIGPSHSVQYSDDPGLEGAISFDANYLYLYTGGAWKRLALSTFAADPGGGDPGGGGEGSTWLGLNIGNTTYYDTCLPMVDFFKSSHDWPLASSDDGATWDTGEIDNIPLDADGYPTSAIPYTSGGYSNILTYPAFVTGYAGTYTIDFDGTGTLSFINGGTVTHPSANQYKLTFGTADYTNTVFIRVATSSASPNNVRNIRVTAPCPSDDGVWNNDYINQMNGLAVLRTMGVQRTNDNPVVTWGNRNKMGGGAGDYASLAAMGVKLECDMWICIPHAADDTYVTNAATAMAPLVAAGKKVWVEYSNEVWNGIFAAQGYCQTQGLAAGLDEVGDFQNPESGYEFWAAMKYYVRRSAQVWKIFRDTLDAENVKAVLGGWAYNGFVSEQLLGMCADTDINPLADAPDNQVPDVLAIAPYIGYDSNEWAGLTVAQVLSNLTERITTQAVPAVTEHIGYCSAASFTPELACYEAGHHLYSNPALGATFVAANRDPGMQTVYSSYITALKAAAGETPFTLCFFDSCRAPSSATGDTWGAYEYQSQVPSTAYKMVAIKAAL